MINTIACWNCKAEIEISPEGVSRPDLCPGCSAPGKCCFNCRFYNKEAFHQCNEPQAEWVRYKEKANFCEYFRPRFTHLIKKEEATLDTPEARKKAWDSLFNE